MTANEIRSELQTLLEERRHSPAFVALVTAVLLLLDERAAVNDALGLER